MEPDDVTKLEKDVASDKTTEVAPEGEAVKALSKGKGDAESQQTETKTLVERNKQLELDIRKLKSSLDTKIDQQSKSFAKEREELEKKLNEKLLSTMDEEERKAYQEKSKDAQYQKAEKEKAEALSKLEDLQAMRSYEKFFAGVVPGIALNMEDGLQSLVQSGWDGVRAYIKNLEDKVSKATKTTEPKPEEDEDPAPDVAKKTASTTGGKATWDALVKKYGTLDKVFKAVEDGILNPKDLP